MTEKHKKGPTLADIDPILRAVRERAEKIRADGGKIENPFANRPPKAEPQEGDSRDGPRIIMVTPEGGGPIGPAERKRLQEQGVQVIPSGTPLVVGMGPDRELKLGMPGIEDLPTPMPKLRDGRTFRVVSVRGETVEFTQPQMFGLREKGFYDPRKERIMTTAEFDQLDFDDPSTQQVLMPLVCVRMAEYGFYHRGFERADIPIGDEIVYIDLDAEKGGKVKSREIYTFEVPDAPVTLVEGKRVGLRQATGMGIIPIEKLEYVRGERLVRVKADFDPARDLRVVDIMRPNLRWALPDKHGIPQRGMPLDQSNMKARMSSILDTANFEKHPEMNDATGWHGSLERVLMLGFGGFMGKPEVIDQVRYVVATSLWHMEEAVIVVSREGQHLEE